MTSSRPETRGEARWPRFHMIRPRRVAALLMVLGAAGAATGPSQEPPTRPATSELVGWLQGVPPKGRKGGLGGTVVWLPDLDAAVASSLPPLITSRRKRFDPRVLVVSQGTTVTFPNVDPIYHNAFSLSPGNSFDLGLYRKGASRSVRLETPGIVRVYCNIHPEMAAFVVVVEGTAFAVVGDDGSFRVGGIPSGRRLVKLWNEMAGEQSTVLEFLPGRPTSWNPTVDASRFRRVPHKNKYGRDYPPATKDADRY